MKLILWAVALYIAAQAAFVGGDALLVWQDVLNQHHAKACQ